MNNQTKTIAVDEYLPKMSRCFDCTDPYPSNNYCLDVAVACEEKVGSFCLFDGARIILYY
jgi:hypothetical protein